MMKHAFAQQFANDWIAAWNSHSIERILSHYTEDFELNTPYIAERGAAASGMLKGKEAIGAFWRAGLARLPNLHFTLLAVLVGVDSMAIHYRGAQGRLAVEVFEFDGSGIVARTYAHYAERENAK